MPMTDVQRTQRYRAKKRKRRLLQEAIGERYAERILKECDITLRARADKRIFIDWDWPEGLHVEVKAHLESQGFTVKELETTLNRIWARKFRGRGKWLKLAARSRAATACAARSATSLRPTACDAGL